MDIKKFKKKAKGQAGANKRFFKRLEKLGSKKLDKLFNKNHEEVFAETDCLKCANCCKSMTPVFTKQDIKRLSNVLKTKPRKFIEKYLDIDEEDDYVLKSTPCPFLGKNNYCTVYADRPKACREFPHTHKKKMNQLLDFTYDNTKECPAVLEIINRMKKAI